MPETYMNVRNYQLLTIRLEPTEVQGQGSPAQPILFLPLEMQIMPIKGKQGDTNYTLLRLAGKLSSPAIGEFAECEVGPIVEESRSNPYYRSVQVTVALGHAQVKHFEDGRSGSDAHFSMRFSALVWFPEEGKFERIMSSGDLQIKVPRSHWADNVLSRWGLSSVKIVEIKFPLDQVGENYRSAYARVEAAEKHFANGLYKQVLTELRLAFEALAKSHGFEGPSKDFFNQLLADLHPEKREKVTVALVNLYKFLHLGPHELAPNSEPTDQPMISRRDARFALTMVYTVFEYITPKA